MKDKRMRVLLASHFGEPVGGMTINYRNLLASSYFRKLDVVQVETSQGELTFDKRGKLGIANVVNAFKNIWSFFNTLRRTQPQLVHIDSAYGVSFAKHSLMALLARWKGIPVVLQMHCSMSRLIPPQYNFWRRYVLFVLHHVDGLVTLSKEWDGLTDILPSVRICYVPNAIDVSAYQVMPRPRHSTEDCVNLLFLGHIGREKGCFDLLEAVAQVCQQAQTPFRLHFVGETLYPGEKERLREYARSKKLEPWVVVHPPEYDEKKMERFGNSDMLVLPSYHEGMPMSVIEAMAAGLPVIGSEVGGIPDLIIPERTGLLVPPGDIDALTAALLHLIENAEERLNMGLAGRQRAVTHFDIEAKAETLVSFYHKLVQDSQ